MNRNTRIGRDSEGHVPGQSIADNLAGALRASISAGDFVVGGSLPSERELMARFGVSRASVREALRMLGAQGLIEVRRGRNGGSYVSHPPMEFVIQSLNLFIKGQDIRFIDLVFAREAIEPASAAQAAFCRTQEQLEELERQTVACEEAVPDAPAFVVANLAWHVAVIEASGNPLFKTFMSSLSTALHTATDREEFDQPTRKEVARVHRQIFNAIRDRDPEAARRRMLRHLSAYGAQLSTFELEGSAGAPGPKPG